MDRSVIKNNSYSHILSQHTLTSPHISSQVISNTLSSPKIDLREFNEYLEQRMSKKTQYNQTNVSRVKKQDQQNKSRPVINFGDYHRAKQDMFGMGKSPTFQKMHDNVAGISKNTITPSIHWKKHESIQKLLGKENHSLENAVHVHNQEDMQQPSLRLLQKKYQDLQQKYKLLMTEAIQNAQQFQADKLQLNRIKDQHTEDQSLLQALRKELMDLHARKEDQKEEITLKKMTFASKMVPHSQGLIESDNSILQTQVCPSQIQQMWKSRERQQQKIQRKYHTKTSQSWAANIQNNSVLSSMKAGKAKPDRYYSAEKGSESNKLGSSNIFGSSNRQGSVSRHKKGSQLSQSGNIQSKTSIKMADSLRTSKIRLSNKADISKQIDSSKCITPTTLHKKVVNTNLYAKYRFQPTPKINDQM